MAGFVAWCGEHGDDIYGLAFVWHEPSFYEEGFYRESHIAAYDVDDVPLRCALLEWSSPQNIANINQFRDKLAALVGL